MVVVLVIGILVAIAIPVFGFVVDNARNQTCKTTLRAIDGASAKYQAKFGVWPSDVEDLKDDGHLLKEPIDPHTGFSDYTIDANGMAHANSPLDHQTYR